MQGVRAIARALGACAGVLCAASAAWAQAECLGFEERTVVEGGTNGLTAVELADLDGDSDQDIVTAAFGDNRIVWYENDATQPQGFRPHLVTDRMAGAADVYVNDINGDGRPDLVASARSSNTVAWFENAGGSPPLFIARAVDALARIALGVHAADVDGDGLVDLLATSYLDGKVFWYEQDDPPEPGDIASNPPRTFTRHEVTDETPGAAAVFAVDLDGDSHADVLVASRLDGTVAWYRNDLDLDELEATPDFRRMVITSTFRGATAVIGADLDRDGDADVVAAAPEDGAVAWWPNGGNGTFPEDPAFLTSARMGVRSVKAVDVDGDGDLDVLAASSDLDGDEEGDDTVAWYENPCGTPAPAPCGALGAFAEHFVSTTALHANDAAAAELDASPGVDVVSVSSVAGFPASQDKLASYRDVAAALPDLPLETRIDRAADGAVAAFAADLDGDLDVDVATAGRTNRITWFENAGAAAKAESPAFTEHVITTNALGAVDIDGGDLDCDGDVDLVSASADDDKIAWYENDGAEDPTFAEQQPPLSIQADGARDVLVIDLDGDGDLDVLSAAPGNGELAWYESDCLTGGAACLPASSCSAPSFVRRVITADDPEADPPVETGARSVHAADMDGDGDLDVLAALESVNRVRWYEHPADPAVHPWTEHDLTSSSGGEFALTGATSVFGSDVDGDGDTDVVATAGQARLVLWLESDGAVPPTFTVRVLASDANDASSAYTFDIDSDGDQDILAAVPGDALIVWFENDGAQPPAFAINIVASGVDFAYSSTVANVNGDSTDDDPPVELFDVVAGERLEVSWFQASGEICQNFDLNGDERIDGMELAWIGRAFGLSDPAPGVWWERADLNRDGIIDGDDLAYLGSSGVFGFTITDCSLICR
jgi:hypothetical protein